MVVQDLGQDLWVFVEVAVALFVAVVSLGFEALDFVLESLLSVGLVTDDGDQTSQVRVFKCLWVEFGLKALFDVLAVKFFQIDGAFDFEADEPGSDENGFFALRHEFGGMHFDVLGFADVCDKTVGDFVPIVGALEGELVGLFERRVELEDDGESVLIALVESVVAVVLEMVDLGFVDDHVDKDVVQTANAEVSTVGAQFDGFVDNVVMGVGE